MLCNGGRAGGAEVLGGSRGLDSLPTFEGEERGADAYVILVAVSGDLFGVLDTSVEVVESELV